MVKSFKSSMVKQLQKHNAAFTYIETLFVIFILLIMLHMVSYPHFNDQIQINETNDEILAVITYYQTWSLKTNENIMIDFERGTNRIIVRSTTLLINEDYHFKGVEYYRGGDPRLMRIVFNKGKVNQGTAIVFSNQHKMYKIVVQLVNGRMRIEKI